MESYHENELKHRAFSYGLKILQNKNELLIAVKLIEETIKNLDERPDGDEGFKKLCENALAFESIVFLNAAKEVSEAAELVKDLLTIQGITREATRRKATRRKRVRIQNKR